LRRSQGQQAGVVSAAALRIAEDEISLLQPSEGLARLLLGQVGGVRVIALAEAAEGSAQLPGIGLGSHPQQVVMTGGHQRRVTWAAGS
jgi:hypothetical protein